MRYINEDKINSLLKTEVDEKDIDVILSKTRELKRLNLEESAKLLSVKNSAVLQKIYAAASYVKNTIYGKRVVLFIPLYISNFCANSCLYCGFASNNKVTLRKKLTFDAIKEQTKILLERGHKRVLRLPGKWHLQKTT